MSVNKQIIVGNVGGDPEVRQTSSGRKVTTISIATTEKWTDSATNTKQEKTTWHRCVAFNRLAEIIEQYVTKGSLLYVEGRTDHQKYADKKTGEDKYSTQVIINQMQMLGGKGDKSTSASNQGATQAATSAEFDDDIPFMCMPSFP